MRTLSLMVVAVWMAGVVNAAVPSLGDFDGNYFRTNALPVTIVGNLVDWQKLSTNALIWSNDGGGNLSLLDGGSNLVSIVNFDLPDYRVIISNNHGIDTVYTNNTADTIGIGDGPFRGATLDGTSDIMAIGDGGLAGAYLTDGTANITALGASPFQSSVLDNCSSMFVVDGAFRLQNLTNVNHVISIYGSANLADITADSDLTFLNSSYGVLSGNNSHIIAIGGRSQGPAATNVSHIIGLGFTLDDSHLNSVDHATWLGPLAGDGMSWDTVSISSSFGYASGRANLTNCSDILAVGNNALPVGNDLTGKSHIALIGSNAKATNSNDFVFGDNAYNYFFPGPTAHFDGEIITPQGTNLNSWAAIAPSAKQDALGFTPVNKAGDTMAGALGVIAGTAAAPSIGVGTTTNGIYSAGANTVGIATSGTGRWVVASDGTLGGATDGTYNIGTFGSSRPGTITAVHLGTSDYLTFTGFGGYIRNPSSLVYSLETDTASPNAAAIRGANGVGTDKVGGSLTLEGGQSTGTGRGGDLIFRTSVTTNSASAANFYSTRAYQSAKFVDLTDATTNLLFKCSLAPSTYCGGGAVITLFIGDGTDFKVHTSNISWSAVNKSGTITGSVVESAQLENHAETAGTAITDTYTLVQDGANNTFYISVTPA